MPTYYRSTPPQLVPGGWSPTLSVYGGRNTARRFLPLSLLISQLPRLKEYLPYINIFFADIDDSILCRVVDLLVTVKLNGMMVSASRSVTCWTLVVEMLSLWFMMTKV